MEKSGLWNSNLSISRVLVLNQSPINTKPLGSKIRANRGPPVQKISLTQKVLLNWYFERKITFLGKFGFKMLLFQVFVKGRRDDFMAHPEEALHWGSEVFPSENDFQIMAKSYLRSGFFYKIVCLIRKFSDTFTKKKLSYYGNFSKIWRKNRFFKIQILHHKVVQFSFRVF